MENTIINATPTAAAFRQLAYDTMLQACRADYPGEMSQDGLDALNETTKEDAVQLVWGLTLATIVTVLNPYGDDGVCVNPIYETFSGAALIALDAMLQAITDFNQSG